jgi:ABC-type Mn2+/Zn2+ transport system permease subunit
MAIEMVSTVLGVVASGAFNISSGLSIVVVQFILFVLAIVFSRILR